MSTDLQPISLDQLEWIGTELHRPECILTTAGGLLHVSDHRGGIRQIDAHGAQRLIQPRSGTIPESFMPNGFALDRHGRYVIANLAESGGIYRLAPDGRMEPYLEAVDGLPMPPSNFVNMGSDGRVWISVSTRHQPRDLALDREVADGFIVLVDDSGARIVADGIGYTNENKLSGDGEWLFVSETIARRISRYRVTAKGLGPRETVFELEYGLFPDGIALDCENAIWIASVVSNRVVRISADGRSEIVLDASDHEVVQRASSAYETNTFGREHIVAGNDSVLGNVASVAFGGPDLRTVYLGSLFSDRIATFRSPVAGIAPAHWHW
jgi:sugar lactone lactonase YvrE